MSISLSRALSSRKSFAAIQKEEAANADIKGPKLRLIDLLCIGIGSTIGSGVFILTGDVLPKAGPSATLSWVIAGSVCLLSALSYIELSTRIPTSGSCYVFSYHTMGELAGVVGAVCLTMEYGISGAGVARSWSPLIASLTGMDKYMFLWYPGADHDSSDLYFDYTAGAIMAVTVTICSSGLTLGKVVVNSFTLVKVVLVVFLVVAGFSAWHIDIFESTEVFFPHGIAGTMRGASALFFGFIGFDEVCCLAGKTERPAHTMPWALAGTLAAAAVISTIAQVALSGMVSAGDVEHWPDVFLAHGWPWARMIALVGEMVLLPLVVLLSFLPQPELLGSMALDGLLPAAFARMDERGTFVWGSYVSGAIFVVIAAAVPFNVLWNMISLGVLLSFNLTNTSLIMLRYGNGGEARAPRVAYLAASMWGFGAAGAYSFWKGFAEPALDGKMWQAWVLAFSALCLVLDLMVMVAISKHDEFSEDIPLKSFRVPAVPFIPGLAVVLNFMLMATFSWLDHLYLSICIVACVGLYLYARAGREADPKTPQQKSAPTAEDDVSSTQSSSV